MYKARLGQWGFLKNNRRRDMISTLRNIRQRSATGKGTIPSRNGKEVDIKRYMKRAKVIEYDLMNLSDTEEIPRGVEFRTPSPSNENTCPSVLQLRDKILAAFSEARKCWKNITVKLTWIDAYYHEVNRARDYLTDSWSFLTKGHTHEFGITLRLAFATITKAFDAMSPICVLSFVLGFPRFLNAGMSDVVWRYLACLTHKRYSESHPVHVIFSSIYRLLQRHGFAVYLGLLAECLPTVVDVMIGAYNITNPYVVGSIVELATLFRCRGKYSLEKVLDGLKIAETTATSSNLVVERLAIRSYMVEILDLIEDGTKKTSRLSLSEESLQHIEAAAISDPTNLRIKTLKTDCLVSLAYSHYIFCENSPTVFNPRYELARHFMERAICGDLDNFVVTDPSKILRKMKWLLDWDMEAGDGLRAADMRRRWDNALKLLWKLEWGEKNYDNLIISDIDSLRPSI